MEDSGSNNICMSAHLGDGAGNQFTNIGIVASRDGGHGANVVVATHRLGKLL